jgi:hypothetical protein
MSKATASQVRRRDDGRVRRSVTGVVFTGGLR